MSTVNRILECAKEKGVKQAYLESQIGAYRGKITEWKKGKSSPTDSEIRIISELLNVPEDYLLGKTDDPAPTDDINPDNIQMAMMRDNPDFTDEDWKMAVDFIRYVKKQKKEEGDYK